MTVNEAYRRGFRDAIAKAAGLALERKIGWQDDTKDRRSNDLRATEAHFIWQAILSLKPPQAGCGE
jgi:hypothetical protein